MRLGGCIAATVVWTCAATASAQPEQEAPAWRQGASLEQQQEARGLYARGNELFVQRKYAEALELYRQALASWNHPSIHFNMAECLLSLVRPLEAYEHIVEAVRYGPAPLDGQAMYDRGLDMKRQLLERLVQLTVRCELAGAMVTLDGELLFVGPGSAKVVLEPGSHQLTARQEGYYTATVDLSVSVGEQRSQLLELEPVPAPVVMTRRWARSTPWVVFAAGAGVAALSAPFLWRADANLDVYEDRIAELCAPPTGCELAAIPADTLSYERRARRQQLAAGALVGVGVATAAVALAMTVMNQPRPVQTSRARTAQVRPALGTGTAGIAVLLPF